MSANWASSSTGARAAGPICATRSAPTLSPASEPMSDSIGRANPKPPSIDRLSQIWRRIHDHKVVQWTVAYIAVAYGLQHGVIIASESLQWPNAVARTSILLLVLGLPLVITFAWYHGAKASRNFSRAELSILSVLLVTSSFLFFVFVRPSETAAPAVHCSAHQGRRRHAYLGRGLRPRTHRRVRGSGRHRPRDHLVPPRAAGPQARRKSRQ